MGVHISLQYPVFISFSYIPRSGIADMIDLFLIFWEISHMFSIVVKLTYIPTNSVQGFVSPHPHEHLPCLLGDGHNRWEVVSPCGFDFHYSGNYWDWTAFHVQFSSVTQSCSTLCNPMNHSTPGLPVHHQLPEPTQTHVHCVGDAIQPSHLLLSPSPPALNLFHYQGLFKWVRISASGGPSILVSASASVLPMNMQDRSPLGWTGWISLQSEGLSRAFSNTAVQKHQFFSAQLSSPSNCHIHTWPLEKPAVSQLQIHLFITMPFDTGSILMLVG